MDGRLRRVRGVAQSVHSVLVGTVVLLWQLVHAPSPGSAGLWIAVTSAMLWQSLPAHAELPVREVVVRRIGGVDRRRGSWHARHSPLQRSAEGVDLGLVAAHADVRVAESVAVSAVDLTCS